MFAACLGVMSASQVLAADEAGVPVYSLGPIVVTANRVEQPILEAKSDISVVPRKEIEEMHISNVEEALRTVPGVQFLNYGANGANANRSGIRINGSKDIVLLVDGVKVSDFQGGGESGYMYASMLSNMDNIERVEVLRGAAAVMYGSGAKGGVINIITRKPDKTQSMIDVSRGSFGREGYKFNTEGKKGKISYNAYYNKSIVGDTKDGDGNRWEGHSNNRSSGVKVGYSFSEGNTLTVNYDDIDVDYYGLDYIYKGPYLGDYQSKATTIKHDWQISDQWSNTLVYRHSAIQSNYSKPLGEGNFEGTTGSPYIDSSDYTYDFVSEQVRYQSGRHDIIAGMDYSKGKNNLLTTVGYNADGDQVFGHRSMKNYSYYIQDDWTLFPGLTLSGGVRHDKPESDGYSPDMDSHTAKSYKLSWDMTDKDTIYAGRSDFYILPSMNQIDDGTEWGNAALKPAYGRTTTIGYNRKFSDAHYLTVNWFETKSEREIGYDENGKYQNYSGGISRGWNAQYNVQIGDYWSARVGWAHLFQSASGDNYAKGYYPKDLATFGIYYNKEKVSAGFDGFYFIRRLDPNYSGEKGWPADKYGVYNLSFNYSPNKTTTVYMKVENLFNKLWAEHTDVIYNHNPGTWYSMPGRSLLIGLQLKF